MRRGLARDVGAFHELIPRIPRPNAGYAIWGMFGPSHPVTTRARARFRAIADDALAQLDGFLSEHTDEVRALAYLVLEFVDARLPGATRLVYSNWNATVVGYSPDGKSGHSLCSVAAYPRWVNLFVMVGAGLPDPHNILKGSGSTVRSVRIAQSADIDERVRDLLDTAIDMWPWPYDPDRAGTTVIAAIAEKRRPRRPPSR